MPNAQFSKTSVFKMHYEKPTRKLIKSKFINEEKKRLKGIHYSYIYCVFQEKFHPSNKISLTYGS